MTDAKRCAIYIRVSTAMQVMDGWSLDAQREGLTKYAQAKGWKIVGVYADEGKSARKRLKDRKEIHQLLRDVEAGEIDVILFKELDRWFRNVSDFYKVQDVLDRHGVEWVSERQPTLTMATKEGRLAVNILLSVGQTESDSTGERIRYTLKYLNGQGRWAIDPRCLPRGYTTDEDKHVIQDPEEAEFVRLFIDEAIRQGSVGKAVENMYQLTGKTIGYTNAVRLLRNPMLYGAYKGMDNFVSDPIIDKETFDNLQLIFPHQTRKSQKYPYIFSGLLRCGLCGATLSGSMNSSKVKNAEGQPYYSYRCNKFRDANNLPVHPYLNIMEISLEKLMIEAVKAALEEQLVETDALIQKAAMKPKRKSNKAAIEKKLEKLEDLYLSSDMTKERYLDKRDALLAQIVEEDTMLEEAKERKATLEEVKKIFTDGFNEAYSEMENEDKRTFWRSLIKSATISQDRTITEIEFVI